jgi:hypothetical protein
LHGVSFATFRCTPSSWTADGCGRRGILHAVSTCTCGGWDVSQYITQLVVETALLGGSDLLPYTTTPLSPATPAAPATPVPSSIDTCSAFADLCRKTLDHVNCPRGALSVMDCTAATSSASSPSSAGSMGGYSSTWQWTCGCGERLNLSTHVLSSLLSGLLRPAAASAPALVLPTNTYCTNYLATCGYLLTKIGCPAKMQFIAPCNGSSTVAGGTAFPTNVSSCACGGVDAHDAVLSTVIDHAIVDALLKDTVQRKYLRLPTFWSPYTAIVRSNPFNQLT